MIPAYSVGPPPPAGSRRLHLNEYRYAHPPEVIEALRSALAADPVETLLNNYQTGPDPHLVEALARYVGAPSGRNVVVASGSDEILRAVVAVDYIRGHRALLIGVPSYTHFEHHARLRGFEIVAYSIGIGQSLADRESSLTYYSDLLATGCLVYLCSPNNPTGDLWTADAVARLASAYPRSLFLIDEAYIEFAIDDAVEDHARAFNARSLVPVALQHANVIVARTLSKAFGLAAMRVGYAVCSDDAVRVAISPKDFNPLAARVARAALSNLAHYRTAAVCARNEVRFVVSCLRSMGWRVTDAAGNFYLVYVGDTGDVMKRLAGSGIQVRDRSDLPGLSGCVRITAGTADDSQAVVSAFSGLTPPSAPPPQAYHTSKGAVAALKRLTKKTVGVLSAAGVQYWAQSGTMLGIFRHGGMIPWDDDCDLAYLRNRDPDPLSALVPVFRANGLALQRNRTDAYWQVGTNGPGEVISSAHVDIFSYTLSDGQYVLDDTRFREEDPDSPQAHCNTKYTHDELFPLSTAYSFYDLTIPMPAESEKVLRRSLGADFMTVAKARTKGGGLASFVIRDTSPA